MTANLTRKRVSEFSDFSVFRISLKWRISMSREVNRSFTRPARRLAKRLLVWIGTVHMLAALGHAEGQTIFVRFDLKIPMLKTHPTISQAEAEISQIGR